MSWYKKIRLRFSQLTLYYINYAHICVWKKENIRQTNGPPFKGEEKWNNIICIKSDLKDLLLARNNFQNVLTER